ncbi:hypothetical protein L1994_02580 [Methanomicrobium antiquum]|uniref:UPF0146 protein L1994_02580 n=1 Tax=Methanomicrobium antiquum TaxID=487686 RepID=A0AAF0FRM9_9EURY|nr:UPF0146 family protein [Methanomicrobium antiquum]WFN37292.1 hypothetical protein L1994_02580 [Methanomicrobium antiquum]
MENHKGIEEKIFSHLKKYPKTTKIIEIGIGKNFYVAEKLHHEGYLIKASDIKKNPDLTSISYRTDDIFSPDISLYTDADLIYSIRPGVEMMPALIEIAKKAECELLVYHLGNEIYKDGGELIDCGVILHRYYKPPR